MTFTDDDLKRWKEFSKQDWKGTYHINMPQLQALLARLEAAENVINVFWSEEWKDIETMPASVKAWRKVAGK